MVVSLELNVVRQDVQDEIPKFALKSEWFAIASMCCLQMISASLAALPAPFYPQEAIRRGVSATEYGLVFGIFYISGVLWSLIFGKHVAYFGPKNILKYAVAVTCMSCILFGLLEYISSYLAFIVLSFLLRITESIGTHSTRIALATAAAEAFPEKKGTVLAAVSTSHGIGAIIGPALGSLIFTVGGYKLPFIVLGLALVMSWLIVNLFIRASSTSDSVSSVSMWKLALIPGVMLNCLCLLSSILSASFLLAVLAQVLEDFHLHVMTKGLLFVIGPFVYTIFTPLFGRISDKYKRLKRLLLVGCVLSIVAFLLIGPAPYTEIPKTLGVFIFGLVLHGLSMDFLIITSRNDSICSALASGLEYGVPLLGVLSSMWTVSTSLGAFIGASMSGYLYDTVGFQYAVLFVIGLFTLLAVFNIIVMITTKT